MRLFVTAPGACSEVAASSFMRIAIVRWQTSERSSHTPRRVRRLLHHYVQDVLRWVAFYFKFADEVIVRGFCSLIRLRQSSTIPIPPFRLLCSLLCHLLPSPLVPSPGSCKRPVTVCADVFHTQQVPVPTRIQFSDSPSHAPVRHSDRPRSPPDPGHNQTRPLHSVSQGKGPVMVYQVFEGSLDQVQEEAGHWDRALHIFRS